jgi:hypothetical protein
MIAVVRMEVIIYMPAKSFRSVKPRTHADKYAAVEPLRPVVAVRRAIVGCGVIVSIGTIRGWPDINDYLSL